jgi:signal transduction histidine kinase
MERLARRILEREALTVGSWEHPGPYDLDTNVIYAASPIRVQGEIVGLLTVVREGVLRLTVEEAAFVSTIADQVGFVVESARLRQVERQEAVRQERERLARDLHDSVTQLLYSLSLFSEAGWEELKAGKTDGAEPTMRQISEIAQQIHREMRLMVYELRPQALERDGLVVALQRRLDAVEKRAKIEATLHSKLRQTLPVEVEDCLYHVAQEALNNALKHAGASKVGVLVRSGDGRVDLEVVDNGHGFDMVDVKQDSGMGFHTMEERMKALGGWVAINSQPGAGTRVRAGARLKEVR